MSYGVGRRRSSDPEMLWLWHRPVATAQIRPLAWEPPYAAGVALERQKDKKKERLNKEKKQNPKMLSHRKNAKRLMFL